MLSSKTNIFVYSGCGRERAIIKIQTLKHCMHLNSVFQGLNFYNCPFLCRSLCKFHGRLWTEIKALLFIRKAIRRYFLNGTQQNSPFVVKTYPKRRVSLRPPLLFLVEENLRFGSRRFLRSKDDTSLLSDVFIQKFGVAGHGQLTVHSVVVPQAIPV
jgi:hypothetical protein